VEARAGKPLTLRFLRTTDDTCAKEVVFPSLGVRKSLPLGQEVDIALVPTSGETRFTCGMGMVKGSVFAN
jgi:plastocyanin domain-containing protein